MKQKYFSPSTIRSVAENMLAEHESFSRSVSFNPEKATLLVLDLQNFFLDPQSHAFIPSAPAILPGIAELVRVFTRANRPVIATRHTNSDENSGIMSSWWRDTISPDSSASELISVLDTDNLEILEKHSYDAFYETDLDKILSVSNTNQIVITGVMTHICCDSTARSSFQHGYNVFFCIDGTATYNETLHRSSLLTLSHCCVVPVLVSNLIEIMEGSK